ncbi:MAG: AarF/ABC1/UbiB kinase family protein [Acidimicrobiia bacterium]|nr:AarF/ABC1/UbiB kinase family protein [Acidimicrobiia bacterium]
MAKKKSVSTGRVGRARRVGTFGAGMGSRLAWAGMRSAGRSDEHKAEVLADFHLRTAEQMRAVLGTMKGAAAKLGQMASFIDSAMIPPEFADLYHEVLAELRDDMPPMTYDELAEMFERDHGGPPDAVFEEFDPEPIAAASIGQVHSARLFGGDPVVVKVQYPGIDKAIMSDLKNAKAFMWLLPVFAPGLEAGPLVKETERALLEELDYRREAAHQERFAAVYRGHPFVVVPEPVLELCGAHTLVCEDVRGTRFDDFVATADAADRNRAAEIIFRYSFGTLYRFGFFNADTHPGNYAFREDGKVVFYDYGAVKQVSADDWRRFVGMTRPLMEGDTQLLFEECVANGFVRRPDKVEPERLHAWLDLVAGRMLRTDGDVTITREMVGETVASTTDPLNDWYSVTKWLNVDPEALLIGRMQIGIMAVLAKMDATANWHSIVREWVYDEVPTTSLGRTDADFFSG